jgi:Domain of unknown function (DUF5666)
MRFRTVMTLVTMFCAFFTIAAWSAPLSAPPASNLWPPEPENQSVAGKISAIGDAEFSVDIAKGQNVDTVRFLVDGNTKVEGKLSVGAQAAVEYRSEDGKNLAVRVVVTPASGVNSY